jgi:hypothetical protein
VTSRYLLPPARVARAVVVVFLSFVVLNIFLVHPARAIVAGQTGEFPSAGAFSGGASWTLANSPVHQWNTYWNGTWFIGSAVAVAPNYLLTAGHVGATPGQSYTTFGGTTYTAVDVITPPVDSGQSTPPDLALVRVDHTLPNFATLYTGSFSFGQKLFIAGYGVTGTYNPSTFTYTMDSNDGVARWGTNSVYWTPFRTSTGAASSSVFGFSAYDTNTPYEAFFGSGDSGGGTFVQVNGLWQLAGINAYAYPTSGGYYASSAVAIPAYDDWIASNIASNLPEPLGGATTLVTAIATGAFIRRRRPENA